MAEHSAEGFLETEPGIRLFWRTFGTGSRHLVIEGGMYLEPVFKQLASASLSVTFLDQRGRGRSTPLSDSIPLGVAEEIADLDAVREHIGTDRISLVGWSYMGAISARYALTHPAHTEKVIQVCPLPARQEPWLNMLLTSIQQRQTDENRKRLTELQEITVSGSDSRSIREEISRLQSYPQMGDPAIPVTLRDDFFELENERHDRVFNHQIPAVVGSFGNWDWRSDLSKFKSPLLTIHGDRDPIPLESAMEWCEIVPDGRLVVIEGAGHLPWIEQPEKVLSEIRLFLE